MIYFQLDVANHKPCIQKGNFLMTELTAVSETLYVPLLGRIYASKNHPGILYDDAALSISDKLPSGLNTIDGQTEYTLLASAIRSKNTDHYLKIFLSAHKECVIVNVGCGLETIFNRNDNGKALWFELDLPEVLKLRSMYFPESARDRYLPCTMFDPAWKEEIKAAHKPIMIVASGLFYYFKEEQVIDFIKSLTVFDQSELIFDAVSSAGIKGSKYYMKKMGHQDAEMFFCVDNAKTFAAKISPNIQIADNRRFYGMTNLRSRMSFATKSKMIFSDMFNMVKMIHMKIQHP